MLLAPTVVFDVVPTGHDSPLVRLEMRRGLVVFEMAEVHERGEVKRWLVLLRLVNHL